MNRDFSVNLQINRGLRSKNNHMNRIKLLLFAAFMLLISIMILTGIVLQFLDELISEIDVNRYDALL